MKRRPFVLAVALVALLAFPVVPLRAQEDDVPAGCALELEDLILALVQAQRDADTGNTYQAVQTLDAIQAQIATLVVECEDVLFPLPETYSAPDESIAFNYPADWIFLSPQAGVYLVASSRAAADAMLDNEMDEMPEDTQILLVMVIPLEGADAALTFDEYVQTYVDDELDNSFAQMGGPVPLTVGDRAAYRLTVREDAIGGYLDLIDYTDAEQPAIVLMGGITAASELKAMEPVLEAFAKHLRYPANQMLRKPGVPLDMLAYTSGIDLSDYIVDSTPASGALSPDGSMVAWYAHSDPEQICVLTLVDYTTTCAPIPDEWRASAIQFYWSPDSAYVAWTEYFFRTFREVDIMLYDVAAQEVRNATDDGIDEWRLLRPDEVSGPLWIDGVYTWGPDGYLYFVRDLWEDPQADRDTIRTGLYRQDPAGGEAELIKDLTGQFELWSIYPSPEYNLDDVLSISPDASQIAFVVRFHESDSPYTGIYVMDLTGDATPVLVADTNDLRVGFPRPRSGGSGPLFPMAVTWNMDGSGLYVWSNLPAELIPVSIPQYIDLDTGEITPLLDLSMLEMSDLNKVDEATGYFPLFLIPRVVLLAPDGSGLLGLNFWEHEVGISTLQLVEDGVPRQTLLLEGGVEVHPGGYIPMVTLASDGTLLAWGTLFPTGE